MPCPHLPTLLFIALEFRNRLLRPGLSYAAPEGARASDEPFCIFHQRAVLTSPRKQSSENLQGRGVVSAMVRLHHNFHILVERDQEAQQAFHGELAELTAQHLRNIGLADSEQAGGLPLFEATTF